MDLALNNLQDWYAIKPKQIGKMEYKAALKDCGIFTELIFIQNLNQNNDRRWEIIWLNSYRYNKTVKTSARIIFFHLIK